jgi:threonine dehydrogenase-like Zn-dependent dehydrogenase
MRAVVYDGEGRVAIRDVPEPRIEAPTDALVRVSMAGICGTDLHAIAGHFHGMRAGDVVGHEFVGHIIAVGGAVTRLRAGDHVMSSDFCSCGKCPDCGRGDNWQCPDRRFFGTGEAFGPRLSGAQAEVVRVPFADSTLAKIPHGCSDAAAILIGDNLATGWAAVERGELRPGDIVAVQGGGAVGQLASLSAQAAGAGAVILIEPSEARRDLARRNGAVAVHPDDAQRTIHALSGGEGADLVIEAVGAAPVFTAAFGLVRRRGRIISVGAHANAEWPVPLADCFTRELTIGFAIGDSIRLRERLLRMIVCGTLDPTVVIDRRVRLNDVPAAYDALKRQENIKTLVEF